VYSRTRKVAASGCPACAGSVATPRTSLAARFPALAKEWHPTRNRYLQPDEVMPGSHRKVWWQCPKDPTHEWRAVIALRTRRQSTGCPFCANRRLTPASSLAARFPSIAAEWHPTRNGRLRPDRVVAGTHHRAWWQCPRDPAHVWQAPVARRTGSGSGCRWCTHSGATEDNCLLARRPDLARQWHPTRNGSLTPADVTPGSEKKVWWRCERNPAHEWEAIVGHRSRGRGCLQCSRARGPRGGTGQAAPVPALQRAR
jgi:hypothetical protein